ncbi:MAG: BMP family protein [Anaerolineaceae bacterium]|nr:BMP family protein [Anaerolineaceae bacterium]
MKKRLLIFISMIIVLTMVAACGGQTAAEPAPAGEQPAAKFKAGLLAPGPVNDGGWNQTAYEALKRMETDLDAEISYVEVEMSPAAFEKAFRDFADQGFQFILGHGNEFTDAAVAVAPDYPNTFFFLSSSRFYDPNVPNVIGLNSDSSQPCYVFGYIAAKMGTGAGLIGGMEIPPISESFTGFINGTHAVNSDFPVQVTYLGNWTDTAAAKEASISYIDGGANFLLGNADFAGNGVYQAMLEKNVYGFGMFGDNTEKAPQQILANYILDYGAGLVHLAEAVKDGTFKPTSNIEFGLVDEDVIYIVYNEGAATPVPQELRDEVAALYAKITSGEIDTLAPVK